MFNKNIELVKAIEAMAVVKNVTARLLMRLALSMHSRSAHFLKRKQIYHRWNSGSLLADRSVSYRGPITSNSQINTSKALKSLI